MVNVVVEGGKYLFRFSAWPALVCGGLHNFVVDVGAGTLLLFFLCISGTFE